MIEHPNVLVCIDFSEDSLFALNAAHEFCQKTKAKLYVLHVSEFSIQWDWMTSQISADFLDSSVRIDLFNTLKQKLKTLTDKFILDHEDIVIEGAPFQVIHEFLKEKKIHYLFLGKRGRGKGLFPLGSLTAKLAASVDIPLFIIRNDQPILKVAGLVDPLGPMKNVVELTEELSYLFSAEGKIISLYKDLSARFIGLGRYGVSTDALTLSADQKQEISQSISKEIRKFLSPQSKIFVEIYFSSEKKSSYHLNNILQQEKFNLAILHRHRKSFFEKVFLGSEARRLIEIFGGHLLILPPG